MIAFLLMMATAQAELVDWPTEDPFENWEWGHQVAAHGSLQITAVDIARNGDTCAVGTLRGTASIAAAADSLLVSSVHPATVVVRYDDAGNWLWSQVIRPADDGWVVPTGVAMAYADPDDDRCTVTGVREGAVRIGDFEYAGSDRYTWGFVWQGGAGDVGTWDDVSNSEYDVWMVAVDVRPDGFVAVGNTTGTFTWRDDDSEHHAFAGAFAVGARLAEHQQGWLTLEGGSRATGAALRGDDQLWVSQDVYEPSVLGTIDEPFSAEVSPYGTTDLVITTATIGVAAIVPEAVQHQAGQEDTWTRSVDVDVTETGVVWTAYSLLNDRIRVWSPHFPDGPPNFVTLPPGARPDVRALSASYQELVVLYDYEPVEGTLTAGGDQHAAIAHVQRIIHPITKLPYTEVNTFAEYFGAARMDLSAIAYESHEDYYDDPDNPDDTPAAFTVLSVGGTASSDLMVADEDGGPDPAKGDVYLFHHDAPQHARR